MWGGQGLVLATKIISEVALRAGYDVQTSDIIGLSQRGGKVWGAVKFGDKVNSSVVGKGECDILVAMEALEGIRWLPYLKQGSQLIINTQEIFPNRVLLEKEEYPIEIIKKISALDISVDPLNVQLMAEKIGNLKLVNTIILGRLARLLPFGIDVWIEVLTEFVPPKTIDLNILAFKTGMKN